MLQIGSNALHGRRPRIATVSKVKHEAGIAHNVAAESGWRDVGMAQKLLDFS